MNEYKFSLFLILGKSFKEGKYIDMESEIVWLNVHIINVNAVSLKFELSQWFLEFLSWKNIFLNLWCFYFWFLSLKWPKSWIYLWIHIYLNSEIKHPQKYFVIWKDSWQTHSWWLEKKTQNLWRIIWVTQNFFSYKFKRFQRIFLLDKLSIAKLYRNICLVLIVK